MGDWARTHMLGPRIPIHLFPPFLQILIPVKAILPSLPRQSSAILSPIVLHAALYYDNYLPGLLMHVLTYVPHWTMNSFISGSVLYLTQDLNVY